MYKCLLALNMTSGEVSRSCQAESCGPALVLSSLHLGKVWVGPEGPVQHRQW